MSERTTTARRSPSSHPLREPPLFPPLLPLHLLLLLLVLLGAPPVRSDVYRDCGGTLQGERGFIHSPNFPHPFPDPISCLWVLRAPPGKGIHLYFTQYFLRESFYLAEFTTYTSPLVFTGRSDLGPFDFQDRVTSVVVHKPVLTIEFRVRGKKNIHLRVEEFLNDVHGFNVTYELLDAALPRRNNTCSVHTCSFLGHCLVTADWDRYYCDCFPGYFGDECQYGPHCDPQAGKNMCQNGGSCRYFFGSYVNTCDCPPGFTGVQCETRTDAGQGGDCAELMCSQLCERDTQSDRLSCACKEGFKLSQDNKTCELRKLHLFTVNLVTQDTYYSQQDVLSQQFQNRAQRQLEMLWEHYGLPAFERFRIEHYSVAESGYTLTFRLYADSSSERKVRLLLRMVALRGTFFNLTVSLGGVHVHSSPELRLLGVENFESRAAPEGSFSNLVCRARGSNRIRFLWRKDGRLFNTSLTTRNVWHMRLGERDDDSHMSILNINDITIYDKGLFTCEVDDFGDIQRQDVRLDVVRSPVIVVTPLAANVRQGEAVSFRCYSPDELLRSYSYKWLKNGEPINPAVHLETVEDVQPTGKRVKIPSAVRNANYTCVVTSHVASTSATAHLFVTTHSQRCESSTAMGVEWKPAVHDGFDQQKCPDSMAGFATRSCQCNKVCQWSTPNLARCQTSSFIAVFDKMEELVLGYQGQSLAQIYTELLLLLSNVSAENVIAGDVKLASRIVLKGMTSAVDIPDIVTYAKDDLPPELLLDLLGLLLNRATMASREERDEQRILSRSLVVLEFVSELLGRNMPLLKNSTYKSKYLVAEMKQCVHTPRRNKTTNNSTGPHQTSNASSPERHQDTEQEQNGTEPASTRESEPDTMRADGGNLKPGAVGESQVGAEKKRTFQVLEVIHLESMKLVDKLPPDRSEDSRWLILTRLHSVLPAGNLWQSEHFRTSLTFQHPLKSSVSDRNETVCFALDTNRHSLEHHWSPSACQLLFSNISVTTCICSLPVHVAVFVRPLTEPQQPREKDPPGSAILLMGCIIAFCGLTATLIVYLLACRNMKSVLTVVRLNLMLSLFMVLTLSITCLKGRQLAILCLTGRLLLHLSLLGAFAFLFVDAIHMYVLVHARSAHILSEHCWKFLGIGWGIPVLSVGSTALMSSRYGHNDACYHWCWIEPASWHFYPFVVPMLVLVLTCVLMSVKCVATVHRWTDEWRFKSRKKHIFRAAKNGSIVMVLLGVTWCGCAVEKESEDGVHVVFVILLWSLVGVVYAACCVSDRKVIEALSSIARGRRRGSGTGRLHQKSSSNSFRAYIMPERIEEEARHSEEQDMHRLCQQRDSSKYTLAKKRQLRFLLGRSSGSESDESFRGQGVVLPGGGAGVCPRGAEHAKADSGIFVATDSEKSSSRGGRHHSLSNSNRTGSCSDFSEASDALLRGEAEDEGPQS